MKIGDRLADIIRFILIKDKKEHPMPKKKERELLLRLAEDGAEIRNYNDDGAKKDER